MIDFTDMFRKKGFKYKYTFYMGNLDIPESLEIYDSWAYEKLNTEELEQRKRNMMKNTRKPIIKIEEVEI